MRSDLIECKPTKVGRGCFLGGHGVVYPGVTIGGRMLIMPMTVVTKNGQGRCVAAGTPEGKIGDPTEEYSEEEVEPIWVSSRQAPS